MTSTETREQLLGAWTAINRAAHSAGTIHDDETARKLGFRGGFVGGVTLVGYAVEGWRRLLGLPLELEPFQLTVDLKAPVYQGETARVIGTRDGARCEYRIETGPGQVCTAGVIESWDPASWPAQGLIETTVLGGVELGGIEPPRRTFTHAETAAYYTEILDTELPVAGELPVQIGMWSNPMTPVIQRLQATHTTVHKGSEMYISRLPREDRECIFLTAVETITPRGPGKFLVHVRCEVLDADGSRLALIRHRSAVRRRD